MRRDVAAQELTFGMAHGEIAETGADRDLEEIIRCHERRVLGTALRLLGNIEDAQDAAQEVFLRFHKYRRSFDEECALAPWLYRVTVNVCSDLRRKRRELPLDESIDVPSPEAGADAVMDREERKQRLAGALRKLPEKMRAAVVLRDIEGLTTREVAGILESSEATVRSQISTARLRLRELVRNKR